MESVAASADVTDPAGVEEFVSTVRDAVGKIRWGRIHLAEAVAEREGITVEGAC